MLAQDPNNGNGHGLRRHCSVHAGRGERAKEWINRALLIDPDNMNARYNFACSLTTYLQRTRISTAHWNCSVRYLKLWPLASLNHAKADPDLDPLRDNPRFKAMIAAAERRLVAENDENAASANHSRP